VQCSTTFTTVDSTSPVGNSGATIALARPHFFVYGECVARLISTTVRLDEDDVRALKRARAAGHSASEPIRKGLRVAASRYYSRRVRLLRVSLSPRTRSWAMSPSCSGILKS